MHAGDRVCLELRVLVGPPAGQGLQSIGKRLEYTVQEPDDEPEAGSSMAQQKPGTVILTDTIVTMTVTPFKDGKVWPSTLIAGQVAP